jgi:uncharacterized protein involved in exopolysaccharide biosynthesis
MQDNQNNTMPQEQEIDIMEIISKLWNNRKVIIKWGVIGAVVGLIIAFSIPKTYRVSATLAPEMQQRVGSGVSSIASMMGVSLDNSMDAIDYEMYPDVIASTPFLFDLLDLEVKTKDAQIDTTLQKYILDHQKSPWWSHVIGAPFKALGWAVSLVKEEDESSSDGAELDVYNLPKDERRAIRYLAENIIVSVDKKTGKTRLSLEMQDPYVAATVLNAVLDNLKSYMSDYRTSKSRQDVENLTMICEERKLDYYAAQRVYAEYTDSNKNIVLNSTKAEGQRLQQEMNLAYQVYSQVATQLEGARVKLQQDKPVFAVLDPVTVPLKRAAPSKAKFLLGFAFLAGCCAVVWVLFGRDFWKQFKDSI